MNIVNSLLCSIVTLLMLIQKDESSYCKFLALVKTQDVRASIVLNIEWMQFVLLNCEIQLNPAYKNLGFKSLLR